MYFLLTCVRSLALFQLSVGYVFFRNRALRYLSLKQIRTIHSSFFLSRRDRNSVIIRKSLAIDGQDGVLNTDNHSNNHMTQSPTSAAESSNNDSAIGQKTLEVSGSSGIDGIGKRRERGKGHQFVVEGDKNFPLWCDICGDAIISLLYQPLRCQRKSK